MRQCETFCGIDVLCCRSIVMVKVNNTHRLQAVGGYASISDIQQTVPFTSVVNVSGTLPTSASAPLQYPPLTRFGASAYSCGCATANQVALSLSLSLSI